MGRGLRPVVASCADGVWADTPPIPVATIAVPTMQQRVAQRRTDPIRRSAKSRLVLNWDISRPLADHWPGSVNIARIHCIPQDPHLTGGDLGVTGAV